MELKNPDHRKAGGKTKQVEFKESEQIENVRRSRRLNTKYSKSDLARTYRDAYKPGTEVQTKWGPAIVHRVYTGDSDMAVSWPEVHNTL